MKAVVVYQSLWGNTAQIARSIAEGLGEGAVALTTDEATPEALAGADLIVAGSPLLAFTLPTEAILDSIRKDKTLPPFDLGHPSIREWLAELPQATGRCAAFETRMKWSPGSAARKIASGLERAGYKRAARPQPFLVVGRYGPLKIGELARARKWGETLAASL